MIKTLIAILQKETAGFQKTLVDSVTEEFGHDPYLMLISCLLSLRAKDSTTIHVCRDLFSRVRTPEEIVAMSRQELERIIFRTGFYRNKAETLQRVSNILIHRFGGKVPDTLKELLSLPGVGLKTANLVLGLAFNQPAICVDTHVHRISNRLGLIKTKTPEETEEALKKVVPKKSWIVWNDLLVKWGQNVCTPISPRCSTCAIRKYCKRVGVKKHR